MSAAPARPSDKHFESSAPFSSSDVFTKPFLRWAGSKQALVASLRRHWLPKHKRLVEPFAGSASLFFALAPNSAVLGDSNVELIELFSVVRDMPDELYSRLISIERTKEVYLRWRSIDPKSLDALTRAVRFMYLNRNCFNGIFRTNRSGQFNVPMGSKTGEYIPRRDFINCARLLRRAELLAGDFETTLGLVGEGDLVYLDPPYALTSRRLFTEYGSHCFGTGDFVRLCESLSRIVALGGDFVLTYADCSHARHLARQWNSKRLMVQRKIASSPANRRLASEWLISNRRFV